MTTDAGKPQEPQAELSAEEAQRRAAYSHRISAAFGEIVNILMRTPAYRGMPLAGLERVVVPALQTGQFYIAEARSKTSGFTAPVAVVLWASVSTEIDQRLAGNLDKPMQLEPSEWRSGDLIWLVDAVGEPRVVEKVLEELRKTAWKGRGVKMRVRDKDGRTLLSSLPAVAA
jgi:hemolysin-activating ACP:hemolysin acyltransferase